MNPSFPNPLLPEEHTTTNESSPLNPSPSALHPRWLSDAVVAVGILISIVLFVEIALLGGSSGYWIAWVVLLLGFALTGSVAAYVITARRRAVEIQTLMEKLSREVKEHRDSEDRYRLLIENAPDAIITMDTEGRFTSTNPFCSKLTGWSQDEWLGKPFWPLAHADDLGTARAAFAAALQGEKPPTIEIRALDKTGAFIPIEFTVTPQFCENRVSGVLAIGRDVSARRKAEQTQTSLELQLRRAQKMEAVGRLGGGIAHEFNNFLAIIMANAEVTRMDLGAGHPAAESLGEIAKVCQRAAALVRQILTFSHRHEEERCVFTLEPTLKEAVKMIRATIPANVEIETQYAPDCPPVLAEPGQIHQIILNLATNSAHAMREKGGVLEISLCALEVDAELAARNLDLRVGSYVRLTVSDSGHGMDMATQERIFEPFFTTKPPGEGTGLGLPVVHGIVKSHHGAIGVYSEVGRGTTFHIYFPAVKGDTQLAVVAPVEIPRGKGQRILFVDDEVSLAQGAQRILNRLGYQTTVCINPNHALQLLRESCESFDCVMSDFSMPGMSGAELAQECRRLCPELPLILMSGYSGAIASEALRSNKIDELLLKPFSPQILAETLQRVLDRN